MTDVISPRLGHWTRIWFILWRRLHLCVKFAIEVNQEIRRYNDWVSYVLTSVQLKFQSSRFFLNIRHWEASVLAILSKLGGLWKLSLFHGKLSGKDRNRLIRLEKSRLDLSIQVWRCYLAKKHWRKLFIVCSHFWRILVKTPYFIGHI